MATLDTTVIPAPLTPTHAARLLVLRNFIVYRAAWKLFLTGFLEPVLYLFSIGIDEAAEQHAHGDDVEERGREGADHAAAPGALVDGQPVVVLPGHALPGGECALWALRAGGHQSARLRPVRRRKTSSRVERRTSVASGCSPRSSTAPTTSSPWSL